MVDPNSLKGTTFASTGSQTVCVEMVNGSLKGFGWLQRSRIKSHQREVPDDSLLRSACP
jgi:hypothetical protein